MGAMLDCKAILWDSFKMIRKSLDNYGRVFESWSTVQKRNVNKALIDVLFDGDKDRHRSLDKQYRQDKEAMPVKDLQLLQCFNLSAMSISRYKEGRNLLLDMCFVKGSDENILAVNKSEVPDGEEVLDFEDLPVEEKVAQVVAAKKKGATKTREVKKDCLSDVLHKALDLAKVQGNDLLTASIIKCIEMAKLSVPSVTHAKQVETKVDEVFDVWDDVFTAEEQKVLDSIPTIEEDDDIFANFG